MRQIQKKKKSVEKRGPVVALGKTNYYIFALAVVVIAVGYYFLSIGPANSIESLTIAPIILIIGYVVLVPLAILWRRRSNNDNRA